MKKDRSLITVFLNIYNQAETPEDKKHVLARGEALLGRQAKRQLGILYSSYPDTRDNIITNHAPIYDLLRTVIENIKKRGETPLKRPPFSRKP